MNIDVAKIDGYEKMSAEEKVKALETFNIDAPSQTNDKDIEKLKQALSNANSEAANYKKQLREKQTEEERLSAERAEKEKALNDELNAYRHATAVSEAKAHYIALGFEETLAMETAEAEANGDVAKVRANEKAFHDDFVAKMKAEALNNQPKPTPGVPVDPNKLKAEEDARLRHYFGL